MLPTPDITPTSEPYWSALAEGRLTFQQCACGHRWLPARSECPACLGTEWRWVTASGRGRLVSWVVYHTAYHDWFADRLPYNVAIVELEEGPRLITNLVEEPESVEPQAGVPVQFVAAKREGIGIAHFKRFGNGPTQP